MYRWIRASLVVLALTPAALRAQERPAPTIPLVPDQRIRAIFNDPGSGGLRHGATVLEVQGDSLLLLVKRMQRTVSYADLAEVEVGRGKGSRVKWAVAGTAIGTVVGGLLMMHDRAARPTAWVCETSGCFVRVERRAAYSPRRALAITVSGSVVGAVVGALLPGERWERLQPR